MINNLIPSLNFGRDNLWASLATYCFTPYQKIHGTIEVSQALNNFRDVQLTPLEPKKLSWIKTTLWKSLLIFEKILHVAGRQFFKKALSSDPELALEFLNFKKKKILHKLNTLASIKLPNNDIIAKKVQAIWEEIALSKDSKNTDFMNDLVNDLWDKKDKNLVQKWHERSAAALLYPHLCKLKPGTFKEIDAMKRLYDSIISKTSLVNSLDRSEICFRELPVEQQIVISLNSSYSCELRLLLREFAKSSEKIHNYQDVIEIMNDQIRKFIETEADKFCAFRSLLEMTPFISLDLKWLFEEQNAGLLSTFIGTASPYIGTNSVKKDNWLFTHFLNRLTGEEIKLVVNQLIPSQIVGLFYNIFQSNPELKSLNEAWVGVDVLALKDLLEEFFIDDLDTPCIKDRFLNALIYSLRWDKSNNVIDVHERLRPFKTVSEIPLEKNEVERHYPDAFVYELFLKFINDFDTIENAFNDKYSWHGRFDSRSARITGLTNIDKLTKMVLLSACSYDVDCISDFIGLSEAIDVKQVAYGSFSSSCSYSVNHRAFYQKYGHHPESRLPPLSDGVFSTRNPLKSARKLTS